MTYDERTGNKKPDNRSDEVALNIERLGKLHNDTKGMLDRQVEFSVLLQDISISLGLVVDLLGSIYTKLYGTGVKQDDKRSQ